MFNKRFADPDTHTGVYSEWAEDDSHVNRTSNAKTNTIAHTHTYQCKASGHVSGLARC